MTSSNKNGQRLQGNIAIVTGAASGLGLATSIRFALEGATVVGVDLQPSEEWKEVEQLSPQSCFHQADVTDEAAQNAIAAKTASDFGRIDTLVTAAGVGEAGPVSMVDMDAWKRVIEINLNGTVISIKSVLDTMMAQRSGSIITLASVEGIMGTAGGGAYNASKGAVVLLTKNVAIDYGRMGIRCNAICPGFIDTPMLRSVLYGEGMEGMRSSIVEQSKMGRFGRPSEIAAGAFFLASEDSSYMTGQNLVIDGGYTSGHTHGVIEMMGLV